LHLSCCHSSTASASGRARAHRDRAAVPSPPLFRSVGGLAHGVAGGRAGREVAEGGGAGSTDGRDRRGRAGRVWPAGKREGEDALTRSEERGQGDESTGRVGEAEVRLKALTDRTGDRPRASD